MVCQYKGEKYLTGIVSFGPKEVCGHKDLPGVYTKVSSFSKIIKKLEESLKVDHGLQLARTSFSEDKFYLVPTI